MDHIQNLKDLFACAVSAVRPHKLIKKNVQFNNSRLTIIDAEIKLETPCYVVGFGKAVYGMALELYRILNSHIKCGILSVPLGTIQQMSQQSDLNIGDKIRFERKFKCYEGAKNNLPDNHSHKASIAIEKLCHSLTKEDLLIVLISGGGSALLPSPKPGLNLEEKRNLIQKLFDRGANINDVNCIRGQLSLLKSGGLACVAAPARVVSLILSDVINDPLHIIAAGPTCSFQYPEKCVSDILHKYQLYSHLPQNILRILNEDSYISDTKAIFENVSNFIIGNNAIACEAAKEHAEQLGYKAVVLSTTIEGEVAVIAQCYAQLIRFFATDDDTQELPEEYRKIVKHWEILRILKETIKSCQPICLICGGEPTIVVKDPAGLGGRNQHLALELSTLIADLEQVYFLSCGTDGIDGPTDVAGAISPTNLSMSELETAKIHLSQSDSYNFLTLHQNGKFLIKTGHTGTNVMDIHLIIVDK